MPLFDFSIYAVLGGLAGFLGGLIGIGGAFVITPGLYFMFTHLGLFAGQELLFALGTSMACIIFTAISSVYAHSKLHAFRLDVLKRFALFVVIGTSCGAALATVLDPTYIKLGFAAFCIYSGARMLFFSKTIAQEGASMEGADLRLPGVFFGGICGVIGVGGANLFVPYMLKRNLDMRTAISTASALQVPIAVVGTISYIALGLMKDLPAGTFGYVYLPALITLIVGCVVFAPLGAKLSHNLPVPVLKKIFGVVAAGIGLKMAGVFSAFVVFLSH